MVFYKVIVPLQIGVVFNCYNSRRDKNNVIVPLQIGVVFNLDLIKSIVLSTLQMFLLSKNLPTMKRDKRRRADF